jgi:hypothetical protein
MRNAIFRNMGLRLDALITTVRGRSLEHYGLSVSTPGRYGRVP